MSLRVPKLPQVKVSKKVDLIVRSPNCVLYPRIYNYLKAQRTVLENILETISEEDPKTHYLKKNYITLLKKVLDADYGTLFKETRKSVEEIEFSLSDDLPKDIEILGYRIIKCLSALVRVQSVLSVAQVPKEKDPIRGFTLQSKDHEKCCICRICEEYIPIDKIEQHIVACAKANKSIEMAKIVDENAKKLLNTAKTEVLNHKWPYEPKEAQMYLLPVLHCSILLNKLIEIDVDSGDSLPDVLAIYDGLESLEIQLQGRDEGKVILRNAFKLCKEKLRACKSIDTLIQNEGCRPANVNLYNFKFIKPISSGAYAGVFLAKKERTGDIYAIKVISKSKAQQKKTAFIEKEILRNFTSDHIVKLFYTLTGKNFLYIVMEFVQGGDLKKVLENVGCLDEENAKIYLVQIVSALADLRKVGVVHRDLKPDNVLIDSNGRLKLADFGLSVSGIVERSMDFVGTPDYVAPEIILNKGHTFTADYWSLGVLAYELLSGVPPFHGETPEETFMNICQGHFWPIDASESAIDLINSLLKPDPSERLGCNGVEEIMNHPFFKDIDWNDIESLDPPFIPDIENELDTSYFEGINPIRLSEYRKIEMDISASKMRSHSFGPEMLEELKNMHEIRDDGRDEDASNFNGVSTETLAATTIQYALGKKSRTLSEAISLNISNSSISPIVERRITKKKRRSHQSRTPAPIINELHEKSKVKEQILLHVPKEGPF